MADVQQIPIEQLETGRWYVGRGRNGNVGQWDGKCFLAIGQEGIKQEPYFTGSSGCFQPFAAINDRDRRLHPQPS